MTDYQLTTWALYNYRTVLRMKMDLPLLRQQKHALLRAIDHMPAADTKLLTGLLNLIDHIGESVTLLQRHPQQRVPQLRRINR